MRLISVEKFNELSDADELLERCPDKVQVGRDGLVILIIRRDCGEVIGVEMDMTMAELELKGYELAADGIELETRNN